MFIINSEIHEMLRDDGICERSQLQLKYSDYSFLAHDSFVNCTDPYFYHINQSELYAQIKQDMQNRVHGKLTRSDAEKIVQLVHDHELISPVLQREIMGALKEEYKIEDAD